MAGSGRDSGHETVTSSTATNSASETIPIAADASGGTSEITMLRKRLEELERSYPPLSPRTQQQQQHGGYPAARLELGGFGSSVANSPVSATARSPTSPPRNRAVSSSTLRGPSPHSHQEYEFPPGGGGASTNPTSRRAVMRKQGEFGHLSKSIRSLGARRGAGNRSVGGGSHSLTEDELSLTYHSVVGHFGDDDEDDDDVESVRHHADDIDNNSVSLDGDEGSRGGGLSMDRMDQFNSSYGTLDYNPTNNPFEKFGTLSHYLTENHTHGLPRSSPATVDESTANWRNETLVQQNFLRERKERKYKVERPILGLSSRQHSRRELLAASLHQQRSNRKSNIPMNDSDEGDETDTEEATPKSDDDGREQTLNRSATPLSSSFPHATRSHTMSMQPQNGDVESTNDLHHTGNNLMVAAIPGTTKSSKRHTRQPPRVSYSMQPHLDQSDFEDEENPHNRSSSGSSRPRFVPLPKGPVGRTTSKRPESSTKSTRDLKSMSSKPLRPYRRHPSAFDNCLPVNMAEGGETTAAAATTGSLRRRGSVTSSQRSSSLQSEDYFTESAIAPSFRQFSFFSMDPERLLKLSKESLWEDEGPRNLDGFLWTHSEKDAPSSSPYTEKILAPQFTTNQVVDAVDDATLARFCFPNGMRVRFFPRAAMKGAFRMGWIGARGDESHLLVFTNGQGTTDHGVALTIRWEMTLTRGEKTSINASLRRRQRRRFAATRIARWFRSVRLENMLKEALEIAGLQHMYTAEALKNELSPGELKVMERAMRRPSELSPAQGGSRRNGRIVASRRMPAEERNSRTNVRKLLNRKNPTVKRSEQDQAKVEQLTRNAMMRSTRLSGLSPGMGVTAIGRRKSATLSEVTEETDNMDDEGGDHDGLSQRPSRRFLGRNSSSTSRNSFRSSWRGVKPLSSTSLGKIAGTINSSHSPSAVKEPPCEKTRERALESFRFMKDNEKLGFVCVIEKCYTLVGCRPTDHVMLLGPLQQLADSERGEVLELRNHLRERKNTKAAPTSVVGEFAEEERRLEKDLANRRQNIIRTMMEKLVLTPEEMGIDYPESDYNFVYGSQRYFETNISQIPDGDPIKLPLPLPRIGKEWALSRLVLTIGTDSLVLVLKLLLLERSVLIIGDSQQEVTAVSFGLLELMRPFEWASAFIPILPMSMLDFVTSPVPFVAGVVVHDAARTRGIEKDRRVVEAMLNGTLSVLNLTSGTLHLTSEKGLGTLLAIDPLLRERLGALQGRVTTLANKKRSALKSYDRFLQNGLAPREALALRSIALSLERYFGRFCGEIGQSCNAYKRYGTIKVHDRKTGVAEFVFYPDWFINPVEAELEFQKVLVKTQLFSGYVEDRRREDISRVGAMKHSEVGEFIANWIYRRWKLNGGQAR